MNLLMHAGLEASADSETIDPILFAALQKVRLEDRRQVPPRDGNIVHGANLYDEFILEFSDLVYNDMRAPRASPLVATSYTKSPSL